MLFKKIAHKVHFCETQATEKNPLTLKQQLSTLSLDEFGAVNIESQINLSNLDLNPPTLERLKSYFPKSSERPNKNGIVCFPFFVFNFQLCTINDPSVFQQLLECSYSLTGDAIKFSNMTITNCHFDLSKVNTPVIFEECTFQNCTFLEKTSNLFHFRQCTLDEKTTSSLKEAIVNDNLSVNGNTFAITLDPAEELKPTIVRLFPNDTGQSKRNPIATLFLNGLMRGSASSEEAAYFGIIQSCFKDYTWSPLTRDNFTLYFSSQPQLELSPERADNLLFKSHEDLKLFLLILKEHEASHPEIVKYLLESIMFSSDNFGDKAALRVIEQYHPGYQYDPISTA